MEADSMPARGVNSPPGYLDQGIFASATRQSDCCSEDVGQGRFSSWKRLRPNQSRRGAFWPFSDMEANCVVMSENGETRNLLWRIVRHEHRH